MRRGVVIRGRNQINVKTNRNGITPHDICTITSGGETRLTAKQDFILQKSKNTFKSKTRLYSRASPAPARERPNSSTASQPCCPPRPQVIERYELPVRLTANQNLILLDVDPAWKTDIATVLGERARCASAAPA